MSEEVAVRWVISGRVQGVGFRWFTLRRAQALGLTGWVSNLPDGRVEVVAKGPSEAIADLEAALREGPQWADVDRVENANFPHEAEIGKFFDVR
jgi:acylphosphatase